MADRDYSSIYNIKDFILNDIAPSYFDIPDISLLNVGLFGMVTDIGATTTQDNFNVTGRYITELLPGKSVLPEFIYAEAANYGLNNLFSTCASCQAMLFIKESNIIDNGKKDGDYIDYYIDSNMKVYIDNVIFSIPYDIKIRARYYNGSYNYNCAYDTSWLKNSIMSVNYPYIKYIKTKATDENATYIGLRITLLQYDRQVITENLITNNTLNIPFIDVPFDDTLCNFEVIYTPSSGAESKQLLKLQDNEPATSTPFCYYSMLDEHTLRISFTTNDIYFVPEYKSELTIYTYSTKGEAGNFPQYTGTNIYVEGSTSRADIDYNNSVPLFCTMITDSMNGKSSYTLEELNALTWEKKLSLNSRTTDVDLDRYFKNYTATHDTEAIFIKTRDDFATREFACYTKIKDDTNILPTNTLNLDISFDDIGGYKGTTGKKYIIEPGQRIIYKPGSDDTAIIQNNSPLSWNVENNKIVTDLIKIDGNDIKIKINTLPNMPIHYTVYVYDKSGERTTTDDYYWLTPAIDGTFTYSSTDGYIKIVAKYKNMDITENNVSILKECFNIADTIEYTSLALMSIEVEPNTIVYYLNSIDKNVDAYYEYINDESTYQFVIKSFHISRNAIKGDMSYIIKATILPADANMLESTVYIDDYSGDIADLGGNTESENSEALFISKLKLYLYAKTAKGHYLEMTHVPEESSSTTGYVFSCKLDTNDIITDEKVEITNMISCDTGEENGCSLDITNPELSILVYYKETEQSNDYKWSKGSITSPLENNIMSTNYIPIKDTTKVTITVPEDEDIHYYLYFYDTEMKLVSYLSTYWSAVAMSDIFRKKHTGYLRLMARFHNDRNLTEIDIEKLSNCFTVETMAVTGNSYITQIPQTADCTLCNTFIPNSEEYWLLYPLSLFRSTVIFNDSARYTDRSDMTITKVPLFSLPYLMSDDKNITLALNKISSQHEYIEAALDTLIANFEIHMGLFNTYGKSKIFTTDTGALLNRTYCTIKMGIKLNDGILENCLDNIKTTIKEYIENLNNSSTSINSISISQLIHILHTTYSNEIDAIVFKSINGYGSNIQLISMTKDLSSSKNIDVIPEFLTINVDDIELTLL